MFVFSWTVNLSLPRCYLKVYVKFYVVLLCSVPAEDSGDSPIYIMQSYKPSTLICTRKLLELCFLSRPVDILALFLNRLLDSYRTQTRQLSADMKVLSLP